ncbi:DJ-1 family glyoxalase III [Caviibacter abscessus]|uniref:DJ-1 family glyoxalase III n=1 Tax=Caviibacter abscessus TaxID=1766719 RepID=UPI0008326208|nr:DJ-1 family glyoxalase III [Caviibacter abscessus]
MKLVMLLVEGFEIVEAAAPVDMLRRAGSDIDLVSVFDEELVESAQKIKISVDKKLSEVNLEDYDLMILPGGAGTHKYYESEKVINAIKYFYEKNKYMAAICAAPSVLAKYNVLNGKNAISFPSYEKVLEENGANVVDTKVVIDGKIITARSAAAAIEFGLELVEITKGIEARKDVENKIVY